jgi:hypothetical protein
MLFINTQQNEHVARQVCLTVSNEEQNNSEFSDSLTITQSNSLSPMAQSASESSHWYTSHASQVRGQWEGTLSIAQIKVGFAISSQPNPSPAKSRGEFTQPLTDPEGADEGLTDGTLD